MNQLHSKPKGYLQDAVQCDLVTAFAADPPCLPCVIPKAACFLLRDYEAVPQQTEIPLTWGHGPNLCVGNPGPTVLDGRCCTVCDADRYVPLHIHAVFSMKSDPLKWPVNTRGLAEQVCCAARFMLVMRKLLAQPQGRGERSPPFPLPFASSPPLAVLIQALLHMNM